MSYTIFSAWYDTMSGKPSFEDALKSLVGSVSKALEEGWEPVGGVATRVDGKDRYQYVMQAMMKRPAAGQG